MARFRIIDDESAPEPTGKFRIVDEEKVPQEQMKLADTRGDIIGGLIRGGRDIFEGGAQLIGKAIPDEYKDKLTALNDQLAAATGMGDTIGQSTLDQRIAEGEKQYQQAREAEGRGGLDVARAIGNVAATGPVAFGPGLALKAGQGIFNAANTARGAVQGGLVAGLMPVTENQGDFSGEKIKQVGVGALTGGASAPLGAFMGKATNPNVAPEVAALQERGVRLTPGQIQGGAAQRMEDKAMSIPVVGDAIVAARKRGIEDFNRAAYADALKGTGIDAKALPVGREGISAVKAAVSKQYDDLLPNLVFKPDQKFAQDIAKIQAMTSGLGKKEQARFTSEINNIMSKSQNGTMLGETYKSVESKLMQDARNFMSSTDAYQRDIGRALQSVGESMQATLRRSNPQYAEALDQANSNYANYVRLRAAGKATGDQSGGFSPQQLAQAVRGSDKSVGKGKFSSGEALMQDLSDAGVNRLSAKYPDSGTAGRAILAGGLGAGAFAEPSILALGATMALPYTKTGQKVAETLLTKRPKSTNALSKSISEALLRGSPMLGVTATNQ